MMIGWLLCPAIASIAHHQLGCIALCWPVADADAMLGALVPCYNVHCAVLVPRAVAGVLCV